MSRLMSVAMTTDAVIERRKTVTRRKGWTFLKPGDTLTLCRKVQGRKPGEPLDRLAEVEVVGVRREALGRLLPSWRARNGVTCMAAICRWEAVDCEHWRAYAAAEMEAEGFPEMEPVDFVDRFFVQAQGVTDHDDVTRIEWRYLDQCAECQRPTAACRCAEQRAAERGAEWWAEA